VRFAQRCQALRGLACDRGIASSEWANPETAYVHFVDTVDYQTPDIGRWKEVVEHFRPYLAVVPDIYDLAVLEERLELARWAQSLGVDPILVPKIPLGDYVPQEFLLGYSVPSSHGATRIPLWFFAGRRVHLLGGSFVKQIRYANALVGVGATINSLDGNAILKEANHCSYVRWDGTHLLKRTAPLCVNRYYRCVLLSMRSLVLFWQTWPRAAA